MLTKDMLLTIMTMIGGGVTACLSIFIFCCVRRRSCDNFQVNANEDIDLSSSHDNSVGDIEEITTNEKNKDDTYFKRWVTRWHRSANTTKSIVRNVLSLKPTSNDFSQEADDEASQVSPEYVAVPARMADKLAPNELKMGDFTGDSAQQFQNIYRASRLSSKRILEPAVGSPHYQHSQVLRNRPMVHYFNPTCCEDGQVTSPFFDEISSRPLNRNIVSSDVSALTSPTVTGGSVELSPLHTSRPNSRPGSVQNDIFTIPEDGSDLSVDSLERATPRLGQVDERSVNSKQSHQSQQSQYTPRIQGFTPTITKKSRDEVSTCSGNDEVSRQSASLLEQLHTEDQSDLVKILSSSSPVLKKGAYSGFIRGQSFSPSKFSV